MHVTKVLCLHRRISQDDTHNTVDFGSFRTFRIWLGESGKISVFIQHGKQISIER